MSYQTKQFVKYIIIPAILFGVAMLTIVLTNPGFAQSAW